MPLKLQRDHHEVLSVNPTLDRLDLSPEVVNPEGISPKGHSHPDQSGNCHKCGRRGHFAKDCRAPQYVINLYRENQQLRNQPRQNYNFEGPNQSSSTYDVESFMTIYEAQPSDSDVALLDSASTHTILTNPKFFHFQENEKSWQHCQIVTMAGSRTLKFREGRATVVFPGGFPLTCDKTMYAPDAPRSLISYRDLRARKIHISTAMEMNEEILELRQGHEIFATAKVGADGLYKVVIKPLTNSPVSLIDEEEVSMAAWVRGPEALSRNLAPGVFVDTIAKPNLWHIRLGHPGTTIFHRMLPLTTGHNLVTSHAEKTHDCLACIQGKYIRRPSP